jgi:hypothetical protein
LFGGVGGGMQSASFTSTNSGYQLYDIFTDGLVCIERSSVAHISTSAPLQGKHAMKTNSSATSNLIIVSLSPNPP